MESESNAILSYWKSKFWVERMKEMCGIQVLTLDDHDGFFIKVQEDFKTFVYRLTKVTNKLYYKFDFIQVSSQSKNIDDLDSRLETPLIHIYINF